MANFDPQQIRQAFTNILQNAIDSIAARLEHDSNPGKMIVLLSQRAGYSEHVICVIDNGLGLPKDEQAGRLTEPYVTTRENGTGLGLAIVKKIMEDHQGSLILGQTDGIKSMPGWQDLGGACVSLILPADSNMNMQKEVA